jgi:hypothetical protein
MLKQPLVTVRIKRCLYHSRTVTALHSLLLRVPCQLLSILWTINSEKTSIGLFGEAQWLCKTVRRRILLEKGFSSLKGSTFAFTARNTYMKYQFCQRITQRSITKAQFKYTQN